MRINLRRRGIALFLTAVFIILLMPANIRIATAGTSSGKIVVVLDPGHDSTHGGGGGNGLREETLNLKIAQYCKAELEKYGSIQVYMTRTSARCPVNKDCPNSECLQARVDYAKSVGADLFVSIHLDDSKSSSPSGAMVIVPAKGVYRDDLSGISHTAGTLILKELTKLGLKNRGLYTKLCDDANDDDGNFDPEYIYPNGAFTDWYGIIRKNTRIGIPSVIVEHCFISNPSEAAKYLKDETMLKALGAADATAIAEFFSARAKPSVTTSATPSMPAYNPNGSVALAAKISGCSNDNNSGKQINFYVNGSVAGRVLTNSNGEASFTPTNLNVGNYTFGAVFEGDDRNASAVSSGNFGIGKASAEVSDGGVQTIQYAYAGQDISGQINLTVKGADGETLTGIWSCAAPPMSGRTAAVFTVTSETDSSANYFPITARITVKEIISEETRIIEATAAETVSGVLSAEIPANTILESGDGTECLIDLNSPYGSYRLPVSIAEFMPEFVMLLAENNLSADDVSIKITMTDKSADKNIRGMPNGKVIGSTIDFSVETVNSITGTSLGGTSGFTGFIMKISSMTEESANCIGVFKYDEMTGQFEFAPHTISVSGGDIHVFIKSAPDGVYAVSENNNEFNDIADNGWYKEYVSKAAAKGIVNGTGNGKYEPDRNVTRAEFVQMIVNSTQLPQAIPDTQEYGDVSQEMWHYAAIMRAKSAGLLNSFTDADFQPDKAVTREEMAGILAATINLKNTQTTENGKKDTDLSSIFVDYAEFGEAYITDIAMIYHLNIMVGVGDGKFASKGVTTRAQAATVQIRMLEILGMI